MDEMVLIAVAIVATLLVMVGVVVLIARFYRSVSSDEALVIVDQRANARVSRTGALVLPILHRAEAVDLRTTTLEVGGGPPGFRCLDRIRVTLTARFLVAVNPTSEDILLAARRVGANRVTNKEALGELFGARFAGAVTTAIGRLKYAELSTERVALEDLVMEIAGTDLGGFRLHEVHLGEILQVPVEAMDPDDVLDAEGIRNIVEATAGHNEVTTELRKEMRRVTAEHDVAADEAVLRAKEQQAQREREHAAHIEALKKM